MVHWIKHVNLTLYWINVVFCFFLVMIPLAIKLIFIADRYSDGMCTAFSRSICLNGYFNMSILYYIHTL